MRLASSPFLVVALVGGLWLSASACNDQPGWKPTAENLTPALHSTRYFPIVEGRHQVVTPGPAKLECESCHGGSDFKDYSCTNCHAHERDRTYAAHFSILEAENFVYEDKSCYACHPRGALPPFRVERHAHFFQVATGDKHANIACISCHQNTADRHEVTCLECHPGNLPDGGTTFPDGGVSTDSKHVEVAQGANGYERSSAQCLRCHPDARVKRLADHLPFQIVNGAPHYKKGCPECHTAVVFDRPWQIDFNVRVCAGCHAQADIEPVHADKPTYRYDNVTCLSLGCHAQGTRNQ